MRRARSTPATKLREREVALPRDDRPSTRIAVVADTHGRPHPNAMALVASERPDVVLHAGDIGDLAVLDQLRAAAPSAELVVVRGNIDTHATDLPDAVVLRLTDRSGKELVILLVHIAVYGPKLRREVIALGRARGAQLVVCGHSHVPFIGKDAGLAVFNPGSIGPRRFALPIVFGVIEVEGGSVRMRHVDCETGQAWYPDAPAA